MGPAIIFDKSAFQALSRDDHGARLFMFIDNTTPILLREIVSDLAKPEAKGVAASTLVSTLASKFCGDGGAVNIDWKALCLESLAGTDIPMTGQIIPYGMSQGTTPDGEPALLLGPTELNQGVQRWVRSRFSPEELVTAETFRREAQAFNLETLWGRLKDAGLEQAKSIEKIPEVVDAFLDAHDSYPLVLHWLIDQLRPLRAWSPPADLARLRLHVERAWHVDHRTLREAAPYAFHCARCLLMPLAGANVLPKRATNHIDAEYLMYLPFCHLFVSNDKLHRHLAPKLLRPYQLFSTGDEFRSDLQRFVDERNSADPKTRKWRSFAFGVRPWPAANSILWSISDRTYPWSASGGNLAVKLDAGEREAAIAEATALVEAVRNAATTTPGS